jgi:hypothetical protein
MTHTILVYSRAIVDDAGTWSDIEFNGQFQSEQMPRDMDETMLEFMAERFDAFQNVMFLTAGNGGGREYSRTWDHDVQKQAMFLRSLGRFIREFMSDKYAPKVETPAHRKFHSFAELQAACKELSPWIVFQLRNGEYRVTANPDFIQRTAALENMTYSGALAKAEALASYVDRGYGREGKIEARAEAYAAALSLYKTFIQPRTARR